MSRDNEGHYIMMKESILQEDKVTVAECMEQTKKKRRWHFTTIQMHKNKTDHISVRRMYSNWNSCTLMVGI